MKTRFLLFILLFPLLGIAQSSTSPVIVHPSPTSMQFDKYINNPVSESTGTAEITIPIYTIKEGNIEIPIYLSYHTSGIKFGQTNGDVGVGWVLHPGYRISRTIHGSPDEYYDMADPDHVNTLHDKKIRDNYLSRFIRRGDQELPYGGTQIDGEFDMFSFSTQEEGGRFVIKNRTTKEIQKLRTSLSAISYQQKTNKSIHIFNVKDGKGNLHRYGQNLAGTKNVIENNTNYGQVPIAPSSWMLTDIQDVHGNKILFDYTTYSESMEGNSIVSVISGSDNTLMPAPVPSHHHISDSPPFENYEIKRLYTITSENIEIKFFRKTGTGLIDSLVVNTTAGKRLKKVVFGRNTSSKHTFLDRLDIYDGWEPKLKRYTFSYINRTLNTNYLIADYWGYYKSSPYMYGIGMAKFGTVSYCLFGAKINLPELNQFDRNPTLSNESQNFTLSKVTYPTGGHAEYEYEANRYMGYKDSSPGSITQKYGGIRVKRVTAYSPEFDMYTVREYKYGENEDGLGEVHYDIAHYNNFISEGIHGVGTENSGRVVMGRQVTFNSKPIGEVGTSLTLDAPVSYSKVTEYLYEKKGLNGTILGDGKVEYLFQIYQPATYNSFATNPSYTITNSLTQGVCGGLFPTLVTPLPNYYQASIRPWNKTYPISKTVYKMNGTGYTPVKKEEYLYSEINNIVVEGMKVRRLFWSNIPYTSINDYYISDNNSLFEYGRYEIRSIDHVLSKKVVTDNLDNSPMMIDLLYTYNEMMQVVKTDEQQSDGGRNISFASFPIDYAQGTVFLDDMRTANILSYPVEKVTYKENGSTRSIVSGEIATYKTGGKGLVDEVFTLEALDPVASASFKFSNRVVGVIPPVGPKVIFNSDIRYKSRLKYDLHDSHGNPLQYTLATGPSTSYIWDYFGQYPVAEVKNALHSDIAYASFEADDKGNWSYTGATTLDPSAPVGKRRYALTSGRVMSKSGLTASRRYVLEYWVKNTVQPLISGTGLQLEPAELLHSKDGWNHYRRAVTGTTSLSLSGSSVVIDEVRLYPADAQMTSYTYEPLVGMTSSTDPSGRTVYYEYDAAQRLSAIRDLDGRLLESYCYNYAGQQVNCSPTTYSNVARSGTFTRNNCPSGQTGSQVTYTVAAGTYTSIVSQADADAQAQMDLNANGQAYANTNGTCSVSPTVSFSIIKDMGWDGRVERLDFWKNGTQVATVYPANNQATETYYIQDNIYDYVDAHITNPPDEVPFNVYLSFTGNGAGVNPCTELMVTPHTQIVRLNNVNLTGSVRQFWISEYCH